MKLLTNTIIAITSAACFSNLEAATTILLDDDFSSSTLSDNGRVRANQVDGGWYINANSLWTISGGSFSNAGTTTVSTSEGIASNIISPGAATGDSITISFSYNVATGNTLYLHALGLVTNGTPDATEILGNTGATNGSLQNQAETDYADISLITGNDPGNGVADTVSLTGTGTFSATYDLSSYSWSADEAPDVTGAINGVEDFDLIVFAFGQNVGDITAGGVSIDDFEVYVVPEPTSTILLALGLAGITARRRR